MIYFIILINFTLDTQFSATKSSAKICTKDLRKSNQINGPVSFEIQMQGLKWTQSAFFTSLYLSISNIFSYTRPVNPADTTFNNYTRFTGTKVIT